MATPYRQMQRRVHWLPRGDELKYLRREGNRLVRARRRRRTALRMSVQALGWAVAVAILLICAVLGARWAVSPGHFQLAAVTVKGTHEALDGEIQDLVKPWMGQNILTLDLKEVESKVREHSWIGSSGSVRVQRKLPDSVVVTVDERAVGGLALVGGVIWLLDVNGMPIDRYGPRYARFDFPIIKGLDAMRHTAPTGPSPTVGAAATAPTAAGGALARTDNERLSEALARGVAATRTLSEKEPGFYAQVSEIDVSDPGGVVLRLEDEEYDLRLSSEDLLRNLDNYFAIRNRIKSDEEDGGVIEYVDLRWKDRIAVMPVTARVEKADKNGGK